VDDRVLDGSGEERFSSEILPRYLRRVPSVDNLIPILYLKGVSSGDMSEALAAILGPDAAGLSATNVVRLKAQWEQDCKRSVNRNYLRAGPRFMMAPSKDEEDRYGWRNDDPQGERVEGSVLAAHA
jgi:hypothetical protein